MSRKGENIRKRKDGRWEARVIVGYKANGAAIYHSLYDKSYKGVKDKRNAYLKRNVTYSYMVQTDIKTYGDLLKKWLMEKQLHVKTSTHAQYHHHISVHIMPALGDYQLSKLSKDIIDTYLMGLMQSGRLNGSGGLSGKTISDIRSIIKNTITYAKEHNYVCHVHGKLFSPTHKKNDIQILTYQEQELLEKYLVEEMNVMNLGILLTLYTGLRIGELCALQWADIDFLNQCLSVGKTLIRIQDTSTAATRTKLLIDTPKTHSSIRKIPIPSWLLEIMHVYQNDHGIYLLSDTKEPVEPRLCLSRYKKILKKLNLPSYTFHALRHTFATRCVELGFDVKSLSEILGHSSINMTLSRYVHPSFELKRKQMNLLSRIDVSGQEDGQ